MLVNWKVSSLGRLLETEDHYIQVPNVSRSMLYLAIFNLEVLIEDLSPHFERQ